MKNYSLAQKAKAHYEDVKVRFAAENEAAIKSSKIYGPEMPVRKTTRIQLDGNRISLVDKDSVGCLFDCWCVGLWSIWTKSIYYLRDDDRSI